MLFVENDEAKAAVLFLFGTPLPCAVVGVEQLQPCLLDLANLAEKVVQAILIDALRNAADEDLPSL